MKKGLSPTLSALALLIFPSGSPAQIEPDFETRVSVTVRDDANAPVEGVTTSLLFNHIIDKRTKTFIGITDSSGQFSAQAKVISSVTILASKETHYSIRVDPALIRTKIDDLTIKNFDLPLVIRKRSRPLPLYARKLSRAISPGQARMGFDLKVGDWVEPQGRGRVADFTVQVTANFLHYYENKSPEELINRLTARHAGNPLAKREYFQRIRHFHETKIDYQYNDAVKHSSGVWDGELKIEFNQSQEGASTVDKDYHTYSDLRMPHYAYGFGYNSSLTRKEQTFAPVQANPNVGYFLRTRVQVDEAGKIVSANYAKIIEDITFDPRGRIEFAYVFNPTPNDRNLEFDPAKNLFGNLPDDQQVLTP